MEQSRTKENDRRWHAAQDILGDGGEMGARIRAHDWAATPLGPLADWPSNLRSSLGICLNAKLPFALFWGPDSRAFYNDAWSVMLGARHPKALGLPLRDAAPELWDWAGSICQSVLSSGDGASATSRLIPLQRHGFTEETYFDFTFSPIRNDDGQVAGVFNAASETTLSVIDKRRTRTLREVAEGIAGATSADQASILAARILATARADVSFCLIYLLDAGGTSARLAAAEGIAPDTVATPVDIKLTLPASIWPLRSVITTQRAQIVTALSARFGFHLPGGLWPEPAESAFVTPINAHTPGRAAGFLITGISPRRVVDDAYRTFAERAASQISQALIRTRVPYEQRRRRLRHSLRRRGIAEPLLDGDASADRTAPSQEKRLRILVVDREPELRAHIAELLGETYDVDTAAEIGQALSAAEQNPPDLLLCELALPQLDGFKLIAELHARAVTRALPVVMLTTYASEEIRAEAVEAGADDVLIRPFTDRDLLRCIAHNLKLSRLRNEAATREHRLRQRAQMLQDRLNTIVENMPVGAALLGLDGRVLHDNPAFRKYVPQNPSPLRAALSEWIGFDDEGRQIDVSAYPGMRALRGEVVHNQTFVHRPPDRPPRHTLVSAIPIRDEADDISGALAIIVDNDATVRTSRALAESEARLAAIFNSAAVGLAQSDRVGRFTLVNDRFCEIVGRSREDILKLRWSDITHADDQTENMMFLQHLVATGEPFETEHRFLRPDGTIVWVRNSVSQIHDAADRDQGILAVTVDISEHKHAAAQIDTLTEDSRIRREEREALLSALPVGVFIAHDPECKTLTTNPAGAAILRISSGENASKTGPGRDTLPFRVYKDGAEISGNALPMQRAAQSGETVMGEEVDLHFPDGSVTNLYEYALPVRDGSGAIRGCVGVFVDITSRKQAEQRQKLLLNELNHRVKNTLAIAQSIAAHTLREIPEPREFKQAFSARLMTLARAHNVLTRSAWQGAAIGDVVDAAIAPFRSDRISQFVTGGPTISLDPNAVVTLSLALHELATNAAKYGALSKETGRIVVQWGLRNDETTAHKSMIGLSWIERGGPTVKPPERRGFGTRLVEASAQQLGGSVSLHYPSPGFECHFLISLPQRASPVPDVPLND